MRIGPWHARSALLATVLFVAVPASGQVFGTFTWQMQPYCNRVTLTLTTVVPGFRLDGSDDQCGAASKASVTGVGVFNTNGTVGLNFTIVTSPLGQGVHVSAIVSPANGQGTWSDSLGNSGTFALSGALPGLPARPAATAPVDVAQNLNSPDDPCNTDTVLPTMVFCGNSTTRWYSGGFGVPGLQVWRDADGQVHIRGSARKDTGPVGGAVFVLPPELRPPRFLGFPIGTGQNAGVHQAGSALLLIYPRDYPNIAGLVVVVSASVAGHTVIHIGEISFRVDR